MAHAWLEYEGFPLGEAEGIAGIFSPLAPMGSGR